MVTITIFLFLISIGLIILCITEETSVLPILLFISTISFSFVLAQQLVEIEAKHYAITHKLGSYDITTGEFVCFDKEFENAFLRTDNK